MEQSHLDVKFGCATEGCRNGGALDTKCHRVGRIVIAEKGADMSELEALSEAQSFRLNVDY